MITYPIMLIHSTAVEIDYPAHQAQFSNKGNNKYFNSLILAVSFNIQWRVVHSEVQF